MMKFIIASLRGVNIFVYAFLMMGLRNGDAQTQSGLTAAAPAQYAKAYKTLNFGDNTETVEQKLTEIVGEEPDLFTAARHINPDINHSETFWRALFDADAEYEPFKYDPTHSTQSDKLESLMRYFGSVGVVVHSRENTALFVSCYQLNDSSTTGCLAIVEVSYKSIETEKLVEGFLQNYSSATKTNKSYRIENTMYPGVYLVFDRIIFSDINTERRATLSIPTGKFTFAFTELPKLSKEQLTVWERWMAKDGKTSQIRDYFDSVKTSFFGFVKGVEADKPTRLRLDPLTYQGWYDNRDYESIIYGVPRAVFASKQILGMQMHNYYQFIAAKDQTEKAKLKKESESSTAF